MGNIFFFKAFLDLFEFFVRFLKFLNPFKILAPLRILIVHFEFNGNSEIEQFFGPEVFTIFENELTLVQKCSLFSKMS